MRRTSRLLVVFGVGLAVLTFVLIVMLLPGTGGGQATPTATPPSNVQVVEAAKDIPLGTVVTADMLTTVTMPVDVAAADSFRDPSLVVGQTARRPITSGAQLRAADFDASQATETLAVPPGKRAMAISITELTGVGKLIHVGDTVDVVITLDQNAIKVVTIPSGTTFSHDDGLAPITVKAPLLLQDIQVIGTIDSPSQAAAPAASPQPSGAPAGGPTLTGTSKLVILAVTDSQAEAILFARTAGTIDLILRSPSDEGKTAQTTGVILKTMLDTYGILPPFTTKAIDAFVPQQP